MKPKSAFQNLPKLLFFSFSLFTFRFAQAQSFPEDLKKMYTNLSQAQSVVMEFTMTMSGSDGKETVEKGSMKYKGDLYFLSMSSIEFLQGKTNIVAVDPSEKSITISALPPKTEKQDLVKALDPTLDQYLKMYSSIQTVTSIEGWQGYQLSTPGNLITKADIYFDPVTGIMRRVVYYYDTKLQPDYTMVVVSFTRNELNSIIPDADFSESRFVLKENNRWKPAPAYAGFSISAD